MRSFYLGLQTDVDYEGNEPESEEDMINKTLFLKIMSGLISYIGAAIPQFLHELSDDEKRKLVVAIIEDKLPEPLLKDMHRALSLLMLDNIKNKPEVKAEDITTHEAPNRRQ